MSMALAGLVILVIGDSQMMNMMSNLHNRLEDDGAAVHSYAMCGATAADYLYPSTITSCGRSERHERAAAVNQDQKAMPTYSLPQLIAQYHPNLVVVELGDSMAGYGLSQMERSWVVDQVHALTGRIAAANVACDWVGPVWGQDEAPYKKSDARVKEMSQLLAESVAPCRYIDSTVFVRPGEWQTRDGTHLFPDGYRKYATDIADAIVRLNGQSKLSSAR
jgi:hypothetical protein